VQLVVRTFVVGAIFILSACGMKERVFPQSACPISSHLMLQKVRQATGRGNSWALIHNQVMRGLAIGDGRSTDLTTIVMAPFYYLQAGRDDRSKSFLYRLGFNGRVAWFQDRKNTVRVLSGNDRRHVITEAIDANNAEFFDNRWHFSATCSQRSDDTTHYQITVNPDQGIAYELLIDQHSYLPVAERYLDRTGDVFAFTAYFTGPQGELIPRLTTSSHPDGQKFGEYRLLTVQDNAELSRRLFSPPRSSEKL